MVKKLIIRFANFVIRDCIAHKGWADFVENNDASNLS